MCNWDIETIVQVWLAIAVLPATTVAVWGALVWGGIELYKSWRNRKRY